MRGPAIYAHSTSQEPDRNSPITVPSASPASVAIRQVELEVAVTSMTPDPRRRRVVIGVDTHKYVHVAVALDGAMIGAMQVLP